MTVAVLKTKPASMSACAMETISIMLRVDCTCAGKVWAILAGVSFDLQQVPIQPDALTNSIGEVP